MKTKEILEEFEDCVITQNGNESIPYMEVHNHLKDPKVTFKVKNDLIRKERTVEINIRGTLPLTEVTEKAVKEYEEKAKRRPAPPPGAATMD